MNLVKVSRKELLKKLTTNRKGHREFFLKAQAGYRERVIGELDKMLADARKGKPIRRAIQLPEPQDHTADYDRVIAMLEMSVDEHIDVTASDFDRFVMDNWEWKPMAMQTNSLYARAPRRE